MLFLVYPQMVPGKGQPVGSSTADVNRLGAMAVREGPSGVGNISTATAALKADRHDPKIFGFRVHEHAKLQRWQAAMRDRYVLWLSLYMTDFWQTDRTFGGT